MKTILVTGSNGLLGQKITAACAGNPAFRLIATSRGADRYQGYAHYIYASLDLLDAAGVKEVLDTYRPQVVIHTAAMTNADTCAEQPEACRALNVAVVADLVTNCRSIGAHLIYLSTDFVFDGEQGPYGEDDEPNPLSVYGASKLAAERLVSAMQGSWSVVRTVLVYGVLPDMSRSNIVLWAKESLEKKKKIQVVNDQWRSPTLAEDLAAACLEIAKRKLCGIYHVSGPEFLSVAAFVRRVAAFWELDESLITEVSSAAFVQPARRPARTGFRLDKARTDFSYQPHGIEEGLAIVDRQLKAISGENISA
ncbi:SDR family oxidoreductase [Pedobacter sp. SYP-B3415]|uniref:SDR family oxidoreductase n=1 Tax=Pedobacter sp. SYP-B3415 TaxID=2496641 RepID=UPI00101C4A4E|nr:SDR family oxidoreductase [Pedobacter sp. SYP-B3415]